MVRFGQIATIILVVASLGWIPFMKSLMKGGIFHYLQSVQAYISPPIAAVFLFGLFYKWINAKGAIVALWIGFVLGIFRFVFEFLNNEGTIAVEDSSLLGMFLGINFLHFALFLFILCAAILMIVSKMGTPQPVAQLELVTFQKATRKSSFKFSKDTVLTIILIVLVLTLWAVFSPLAVSYTHLTLPTKA